MILRRPNIQTLVYFLVIVFFIAAIIAFIAKGRGGPVTSMEVIPPSPFVSLSIDAKAVYVYDVNRGEVLYAKNEEAQLPLASLTKVMLSAVALSELPPYTAITIDPESIKVEGDSGLKVGERWRLKDLINYTLSVSSNDGASAIAAAAGALVSNSSEQGFVADMNAFSKTLGLTQTYFLNASGVDTSGEVSGAYGSAKDMAKLFQYVLKEKPALFEATRYRELSFTSLSGIVHEAENTNDVINQLPMLLASKTGFTDLAGGNLVVAYDAGINHPIIISVLGSTRDGRFEDVKKLLWASLEALHNPRYTKKQ